MKPTIDPKLDLILERSIENIKPEALWKGWTEPELLKIWFCPLPWKTTECEIDLKPGGIFRTVMQSPEGQSVPNWGCYLEIIPNKKLVWTSALLPGFRPTKPTEPDVDFAFTAVILLEVIPNGTLYTAIAIHANEEDCRKHLDMGFHQGWAAALDQLIKII